VKDKLLSVTIAARRLGISARRVRAMISAGKFPRAYKLEGTDIWLIHLADLERADVTERKAGRPVSKKGKK
jgi:excisionase family DNA binding protein